MTDSILSFVREAFGRLISTDVAGMATSLLAGVVGEAFDILLGLVISIYLLSGKEKIASQIIRFEKCYIKLSGRKKFNHIVSTLKDSFENFIVGQCKEAIVLGVLCTLGMWIFRFPYATMIGALIGFTALIPVAGAYIGGAVGAIMILTESPVKALLFIVFLIVLQQIEGNLIYPKVVGESIGLPGFYVLAAATIGGGVMGIPGMLIGVPLAAAAYKLIGEDIEEKLTAKEAGTEQGTSLPEPIAEPATPEPAPKPQTSTKSKKKKKKK
jgi:predicted PurR-regulated permease PerM